MQYCSCSVLRIPLGCPGMTVLFLLLRRRRNFPPHPTLLGRAEPPPWESLMPRLHQELSISWPATLLLFLGPYYTYHLPPQLFYNVEVKLTYNKWCMFKVYNLLHFDL